MSKGRFEQLLRADQRQPFLDTPTDEGLGHYALVRGTKYYFNEGQRCCTNLLKNCARCG